MTYNMAIRLVTFDALHTIVTPRRPIHVQYSEVFAPFLGILDPISIKHSFKTGTLKLASTDIHITLLIDSVFLSLKTSTN